MIDGIPHSELSVSDEGFLSCFRTHEQVTVSHTRRVLYQRLYASKRNCQL